MFKSFVLEQLQPLGPIRTRRMFNSLGLFQNDVMFALIADHWLYIKSDSQTLPYYKAREMEPFVYQRQGKTVALSFYALPEETMENSEDFLRLVRQGLAAAHRSHNARVHQEKTT